MILHIKVPSMRRWLLTRNVRTSFPKMPSKNLPGSAGLYQGGRRFSRSWQFLRNCFEADDERWESKVPRGFPWITNWIGGPSPSRPPVPGRRQSIGPKWTNSKVQGTQGGPGRDFRGYLPLGLPIPMGTRGFGGVIARWDSANEDKFTLRHIGVD